MQRSDRNWDRWLAEMIRRVANVDPTLRPFQWTQSEIARHAEMENGDLRTLSC